VEAEERFLLVKIRGHVTPFQNREKGREKKTKGGRTARKVGAPQQPSNKKCGQGSWEPVGLLSCGIASVETRRKGNDLPRGQSTRQKWLRFFKSVPETQVAKKRGGENGKKKSAEQRASDKRGQISDSQ